MAGILKQSMIMMGTGCEREKRAYNFFLDLKIGLVVESNAEVIQVKKNVFSSGNDWIQ